MDTNSLTGYAQVLEELRDNGAGGREVFRTYAIGHNQISQTQLMEDGLGGEEWVTLFYLVEGQGSVWGLADTFGDVTDLYFYDAFGIHLNEWGDDTPNLYRYVGEQWDEDLGHYYLRARYYEPDRGRFWPVCRSHFSWVKTGGFIVSLRDPAIFSSTHGEGRSMDPFEGFMTDPQSLHKYLYAHGNPVMFVDPSGNMTLIQTTMVSSLVGILASVTDIAFSDSPVSSRQAFTKIVTGAVTGAVTGFAGGVASSSFKILFRKVAITSPWMARVLSGGLSGAFSGGFSELLSELHEFAVNRKPIRFTDSFGRIVEASFVGFGFGAIFAQIDYSSFVNRPVVGSKITRLPGEAFAVLDVELIENAARLGTIAGQLGRRVLVFALKQTLGNGD